MKQLSKQLAAMEVKEDTTMEIVSKQLDQLHIVEEGTYTHHEEADVDEGA